MVWPKHGSRLSRNLNPNLKSKRRLNMAWYWIVLIVIFGVWVIWTAYH